MTYCKLEGHSLETVETKALLITAPASGNGKTSITAGLARYFARSGKKVRVCKVGPDFLDPMLHERASYAPVYQLDLWMMGEEECRRLLFNAAKEADILLVEGVLGFHDGSPSTADLAHIFSLPVVSIIDVKGMAETAHAVALGLATYRTDIDFCGFITNAVASERHSKMIASRISHAQARHLGGIGRNQSLMIPSRHLGLHQSDEIDELESILNLLADAVSKTELPEALKQVRFTDDSARTFSSQKHLPLSGLVVAVARDEAFSFIYRANLETLERLGATLRFFSPLSDSALPPSDSIYLPGGYPELHADTLSQNKSMLNSIRDQHAAGKPVFAECGGMIYACESLETADAIRMPMLGLFPGQAKMNDKLVSLGYQSLKLDGELIHGHTFHYSSMQCDLPPLAQAIKRSDGSKGENFYKYGSLVCSYLHFYFADKPELCRKLFAP